jgi:putative Mg2+ transporter-C (MgtC) family protein
MNLEFTFHLILAALLGGVIGFDRERHHKPAGLRTHILVAIGAAAFTGISLNAFPLDSARIVSNIVVGIGFLGAGTIWRFQNHVQGLTTAASLWATAAMAMAVAVGLYWEALIITIIIFSVLEFVKFTER